MDELDHLGWVVWRSYEIGRMQFGIRTNSEACGEWLDETFSEYRVDEETAPYLSLLVAGDENGQVGKRFHVLYEESRALVRTHDLRLVGEMLLAQFDHVQASERTDKVYIDGGLVRLGDVVGLVPPILPPYLGTLGHRVVERSGLELPVSGFVAVDLESGRVVSPRRALDVPADALDRLTEIHPTNGRERRVTVEEPIDVDVVSLHRALRGARPDVLPRTCGAHTGHADAEHRSARWRRPGGHSPARREGALLRDPVVQAQDDARGARPGAPARLSHCARLGERELSLRP